MKSCLIASLLVLSCCAAPCAGEEGAEVWKMTIHAQAPSRPALRHALLQPISQQTAGNAAPMYLLAFGRVQEIPQKPVDKEAVAKLGLPPAQNEDELHYYLEDVPLDRLAGSGAEQFLNAYRPAFELLDAATTREYCHWELPIREAGFGILLPHLNPSRHLANAARLRARLHLARGEHARSLDAIRAVFESGHDLAEQGLLIQSLVGTGITAVGVNHLREFVQQPAAPNLYWPLANLPRTYPRMRQALEWEQTGLLGTVPQLKKVDTNTFTAADWNEFANGLTRMTVVVATAHDRAPSPAETIGPAALGALLYPRAKQDLIDRGGITAEQVKAMPVSQVLGAYVLNQYREWFDEMSKWTGLPYWQARLGMSVAEAKFAEAQVRLGPTALLTAVPSVSRAAAQLARIDRQLAALQTVEALRAYAAKHDGKLPATSAELEKFLPVPIDPTSGRPFAFRIGADGKSAVLESAAPHGEAPRSGLRIELTLR